MASKTLLFLLGLTLIAVAYGAWVEEAEDGAWVQEADDLEEELTADDLMEYFAPMEKRGKKVGPCKKPDGKPCAICNLKVKNKMDRRRYIACVVKGTNVGGKGK